MNQDLPPAIAPNEMEAWVDDYGDYLYRFALPRVQDPSTAEDLVQETFLAAIRAIDRFEGRASPRTWLTSILKHKIVDHLRKVIRERPMEPLTNQADDIDALFDQRGHWKAAPGDWAENPAALYEQKEFINQLSQCLDKLPDRLRSAFVLRELDGMSTAEIREILDISESNTWVMLYRARMSLRNCLEVNWISQP
ncbi:MAG: sigma-70 family RNA polymerase sigma factor [Desulfobacterales bacterium]|nr:sigma-70 family RNA polymerase sigma factor [Desulfobacterales bacterium]